MSWLNKYPDGGKLKPKPKVSLDDLRPKGLGVQAQDNTRRLPLVDPKIAYNKSWDEYIANQPQVSQARVQSIPQQQANLLKKKDYVYTHPNAKLVDGEIERKNIYRNTEGVPDKGTPAAKQDRFLNDSFEALNAASIIMPAGELLGAGAKAAGRYLTEQTALKNAYKLNPLAFKPNPEMMYRGIGKEGAEDALTSGVFRAKQNVEPNIINGFDYSKQFKGTYYTPKFNTADQYGKGFVAEVPKDATDFRLRYKGKGNKTWSQIADENIPLEKGKILKKDWLQGYKEIPKPKDINNTYWNGRAYQQGPTSTQEVISTSSGMDAVNATTPGYNSHLFNKQGYVPPTTDPSLMAQQNGFTWGLNPLSYMGEKLPKQMYRKMGSGKGIQSIIENKGIVSPTNDHLFFSSGNSPMESYSGTFAVGYKPTSTESVSSWSHFSGPRGQHKGLSPVNKLGESMKNIPLEDPNLSIYRRLPFSNAYKTVNKSSITNPKGFKDFLLTNPQLATAQKYAEDAVKLGIYGSAGQAIGNSMYGTTGNPEPLGKPILPLLYQKSKQLDKKLGLTTFQQGGTLNNWLNKY